MRNWWDTLPSSSPGLRNTDRKPARTGSDSCAGGTYFHKGKLLLTGVVVPGGSLILFGCSWAILVTEFICGMNQLPRVLEDGKRQCQHRNEQEDRPERLNKATCQENIP